MHGPSIRARLSFPGLVEAAAALDPCAGTGAALHAITDGSGAKLYGVELDSDRANTAQASGIEMIQGNAFDVRMRVERLSLLYLNPPYDFEIGPLANDRMESLFLRHTYAWLKLKGILIMVIPGHAILDVAETVAARFKDVRIYRMDGDESRKYDQYALFGVRHNNNGKDAEAILAWLRNSMLSSQSRIPVLTETADAIYSVPPAGEVQLSYSGISLDDVEDRLPESAAWRKVVPLLLPKPEVVGGKPITPLHGGHAGLLATAGMLNGVLGEGEKKHIARWRPVKHSITTVERENGQIVERTKERFSNELAVVYVSGFTNTHTENVPEAKQTQDDRSRSSTQEEGGDDGGDYGPDAPDADPAPLDSQSAGQYFELGMLVMTPGIRSLIADKGLRIKPLLARHCAGDWGDALPEATRLENDLAVAEGGVRIFSSYAAPQAPEGEIWIVTEADRSVTTVLLPSED